MPEASPYVGPRAFRETESPWFFGRNREVAELCDLVVSRRAVLLYAPSGAGKSSLLHAGLIPRLRSLGIVLPVVRPGSGEPGPAGSNGFVLNLLSQLLTGEEDERDGAGGLAQTSLLRGLSRRLAAEPLAERTTPHFLILDQTEELFTSAAGEGERQLFRQLQAALNAHRRLSLLLALREDYLARLDPYLPLLPDHLRTRLRLDLLGEASAREAAAGPARKAGATVDDDVVDTLVHNLLGGGEAVDPVHLQLVCFRLWTETRSRGETQISRELVERQGSVDEALRDYYADRVQDAARTTGVSEKRIRTWMETALISSEGIRVPVLKGADQGLEEAAVQELEAARLIRSEVRRGATWYELAHDRLVAPVREENARWRHDSLSELEHQAGVWERSGHPRDLLVWDDALERWEEWAAMNPGEMGKTETAFLGACRRERRKVFWRRSYLTVVTGLLVLTFHFYRQARRERRRNRRQSRKPR